MSNYPPPPAQFFPPPPEGQPPVSAGLQHYPPPPPQQPPASQTPHFAFPAPQQPASASPTPHFSYPTYAAPPPSSPPPAAPLPSPSPALPSYQAEKAVALNGGGGGGGGEGASGLPAVAAAVSSAQLASADDVGSFNGGAYRISHRNTNTIVTVQLAIGCPLHVKSGVMLAMSPTITLKGEIKFSVKKLISGGHMTMSHFIGPGELILAPHALGDVSAITLSGPEKWFVGKDAFLACTERVNKDYKMQTLSKAMFSGEGLFTYHVSGHGVMWVSSFGAIIRKELQEGEKYIVDNGHLVAWTAQYVVERVASGGILSNVAAGEGLVCKFTGPGIILLQTRSLMAMAMMLTGSHA